jgi:aminobenzoyl-glutamate transport protein
VIFVILMGIVIVLSTPLSHGRERRYEVINPTRTKIEKMTTAARSLLTVDGIRFMFTGVVQNFMNFRRWASSSSRWSGWASPGIGPRQRAHPEARGRGAAVGPDHILVAVGILSSLAADAGYLVLIPLAAAAFISVGRHPLAGLAGRSPRWPACSGERLHRARGRHPHRSRTTRSTSSIPTRASP